MDDPKQFLQDKLDKKPLDSKKMISALFGVSAVLIVWFGTLICMFVKIDSAAQFVSLATIVVSFIGAVTTALITGQSAMEWKSMSTIAQVDTNDKEEKQIEVNKKEESTQNINYNANIIEEGADNAPLLRPFGQMAYEEGGYDDER